MDPAAYSEYMPAMAKPRMYWCPVLDGLTRAELDAGIDLTDSVASWQAAADHLTLQFDRDALEARDLFPRGTEGHLVWLPVGDMPGARMDTWPVRTEKRQVDVGIDQLCPSLKITLRVTGRPRLRALIPAFPTP